METFQLKVVPQEGMPISKYTTDLLVRQAVKRRSEGTRSYYSISGVALMFSFPLPFSDFHAARSSSCGLSLRALRRRELWKVDKALDVRLYFAYTSAAVPEGAMTLTKRQKEVLDFLVSFVNKHGYSPSFEEIAHALKLTSLATVHKHITTLERKGFIRRGYNQSRSIEVTQLPKPIREQVLDRHTVELPLMGRIAAGRPLEAVEDRETLSLGEFARSDKSFVLQVKGNSMIEDHIMNGDYVVIEPTQVANPGETVVALVGNDEATLKRFYREAGGKIRLQPANSEMPPIIVPAAEVKIQGRVVGVLRKY